jgi:hypothetical protein
MLSIRFITASKSWKLGTPSIDTSNISRLLHAFIVSSSFNPLFDIADLSKVELDLTHLLQAILLEPSLYLPSSEGGREDDAGSQVLEARRSVPRDDTN